MMANVDGSWDCVVQSPMGDQKMTLTVTSAGETFSGTVSGAMGGMDVNGEVAGDTLTWKQQMTVPMPMSLDCKGTVDGDTMTGTVGAGAFGSFPMTAKRSA